MVHHLMVRYIVSIRHFLTQDTGCSDVEAEGGAEGAHGVEAVRHEALLDLVHGLRAQLRPHRHLAPRGGPHRGVKMVLNS